MIFKKICLPIFCLLTASIFADTKIKKNEEFVLNRKQFLKNLEPETRNFYYFSILNLQQQKKFVQAEKLLQQWSDSELPQSGLEMLMTRQKLLVFDANPEQTYELLEDYIENPTAFPEPREKRRQEAVNRITTEMLKFVNARELSDAVKWSGKLASVDSDFMVKQLRDYKKLGTIKQLRKMSFHQLKAFVKKFPESLQESKVQQRHLDFINAYYSRDTANQRLDVLKRQLKFIQNLPVKNESAHTELKIYKQILGAQHTVGIYDQSTLVDILEILHNSKELGLPLKREALDSYLIEHFRTANNQDLFSKYYDKHQLNLLFTKAKVFEGTGDPAQLNQLMKKADWQKLKEKKIFTIASRQPQSYKSKDLVELTLNLKNVSKLQLQIFEIDQLQHYITAGHAPDFNIDLMGQRSHHEREISFTKNPFTSKRYKIALPELKAGGCYLIKLISKQDVLKTMITKGAIQHLFTNTSKGQVYQLFMDDSLKPLKNGYIRMGTKVFPADQSGKITIPYAPKKLNVSTLLLYRGDVVTKVAFKQHYRNFQFSTQTSLNPKGIIPGSSIKIPLQVRLKCNSEQMDPKLIKGFEVSITSGVSDGSKTIGASQSISFPSIPNDGNLTLNYSVPPKVVNLSVSCQAKVYDETAKEYRFIGDSFKVSVNPMESSFAVVQGIIEEDEKQLRIFMCGRNGEPLKQHIFDLKLDFFLKRSMSKTLITDDNGYVYVEKVPHLKRIYTKCTSHNGRTAVWSRTALPNYPASLSLVVNQPFALSYNGVCKDAKFPWFNLSRESYLGTLEQLTDQLKISKTQLIIPGLPAGSYKLFIRESGQTVDIMVRKGEMVTGNYLKQRDRFTQIDKPEVSIAEIKLVGDQLVVKSENGSKNLRFIVTGTHFPHSFNSFASKVPFTNQLTKEFPFQHRVLMYRENCRLSDEEYYILKRKSAKIFPGNMLERPGIILNPVERLNEELKWTFQGGGRSCHGRKRALGKYGGRTGGKTGSKGDNDTYNSLNSYYFVSGPDKILSDLKADKSGVLKLDLKELKKYAWITIIATDDKRFVQHSVPLGLKTITKQDLRFKPVASNSAPLGISWSAEVLKAGKKIEVKQSYLKQSRVYSTLGDAMNFLINFSENDELYQFRPLMKWPNLTAKEKFDFYASYNCHETNFFLYQKDPDFFKNVIEPHLQNKVSKTFMDHFLLGNDLKSYLELPNFRLLNLVEQILLTKRYKQSNLLKERFALLQRFPGQNLSLYQHAANMERNVVSYIEELEVEEPEEEIELEEEEWEDEVEDVRSDESYYRCSPRVRPMIEQNYYQVKGDRSNINRVATTFFWKQLLAQKGNTIVSTDFVECSHSLSESLFCLAFLDLPFTDSDNTIKKSDDLVTFASQKPALLYFKKHYPLHGKANDTATIDVRFSTNTLIKNGGKQVVVQPGTIITLRTDVSNTLEDSQILTTFMQIPEGAIPIKSNHYSAVTAKFEELESTKYAISFYFPEVGDYKCKAIQVVTNSSLCTQSDAIEFKVQTAPLYAPNKQGWRWISFYGSQKKVLDYISKNHLEYIALDRIFFRLYDAKFYHQVIKHLRSRGFFHSDLWAFSLQHKDQRAIQEFLDIDSSLRNKCGGLLNSRHIKIPRYQLNPSFRLLQFDQLHLSRVHSTNDKSTLRNEAIWSHYKKLLYQLTFHSKLKDLDQMNLTILWLLQNRIEKAIDMFSRIDRKNIVTKVQYDYLKLYIQFYLEQYPQARKLASQYVDYPVKYWQQRFRTVITQLDEAERREAIYKPDSIMEKQTRAAAKEPTIGFDIKSDHTLQIKSSNLKQCEINYYKLDIEYLFSSTPFVESDIKRIFSTKPHLKETCHLNDSGETSHKINPKYQTGNFLIAVTTKTGLIDRKLYLASKMNVRYQSAFGQVKVSDLNNKPLSKVYVKVYAKVGGKSSFYKDGYTDLRGRFDYATVSTSETSINYGSIKEFAILISSPKHGVVRKQLKPPISHK